LRHWIRLLLVCLAAGAVRAQTVFVYSLDGLGHQLFTQSPVTRPLQTLHRLAARGAMAEGIQPAFPSTTANSHAALWTGVYGDVSNITANSQPALPRAEHTFLERRNGYRADQLAAEPIWVTAARQGLTSVVYQAPQVYPFLELNTHPQALSVNGYQSRQVAGHAILRRKDLVFHSPTAFHFQHGPIRLEGSLTRSGIRIGPVDVPYVPVESGLKSGRPLARRFSEGLLIREPVAAMIYFRLFAYSPTDLLLYVSPVQELAMSQGDPLELIAAAGGFIGNSYQGSLLSEAQALETMELVVRQNLRQTVWLYRKQRPRLMVGYLPSVDELGHRYLGLYAHGEASARRWMRWGFTIVERWSREIAALAGPADHLVITSDHGMAPTTKLVNVNEILRRAGLGDVAVHVYNSVLLNDRSWKNGAVTNRVALREQVRAALEAVRDPEPVFVGFYTPEEHGARYGIGGPAGSDLYFDLRSGYAVQETVGEIFPALPRPRGNHGFRPDREDMLATLFVVGPKAERGTRWPRKKSIEVAALLADLLGIKPAKPATAPAAR
jgi:hypothetical protein